MLHGGHCLLVDHLSRNRHGPQTIRTTVSAISILPPGVNVLIGETSDRQYRPQIPKLEQSSETPRHVLLASQKNAMPLVDSVGLTTSADLKIARWRGRLHDVETTPRGDYHTICYSNKGAVVRRLDTASPILVSGSFFIQPADAYGRFESDDVLDYFHFYIRVGVLEDLVEALEPRRPCTFEFPDAFGVHDQGLAALVQGCLYSLMRGNEPSQIELDCWAQAFAGYLAREAPRFAITGEERQHPSLEQARLARVLEAIDADLQGDLSLSSLAKVACLSPFHFSRAFKAATGLSPHTFVLRRRIERAQDLLMSSELAIASIAYAVGFSSQSHLNNAFKRETGFTPGAYRRTRNS